MPWKESRIMDQRLQFLASYQEEEMSCVARMESRAQQPIAGSTVITRRGQKAS